jgi:cobalt/nickel transport system permease protein
VHVPDGFLNAPTSVATGVVAAGAIALALRGARRELDDRTAPLAGLVATFVFAAQMINFPVAGGTSGHLMGGALAVALVGPWTAILCLSVVLMVQGLFMADGGITALGTNIVLIGVVTVAVSWLVIRGLQTIMPRRVALVPLQAALAALVSVPVAAGVFTLLFAIGGVAPIDASTVLGPMLGWHTLIGLGEALITGLVVGSVVAARPDLVSAARGALAERTLEIRTPGASA